MDAIRSVNRVVYNYTQWPLAVASAEPAKPEVLKIIIRTSGTERQRRIMKGEEEARLDLKRVQPIKEISPSGKSRKVSSAYDRKMAIKSYQGKETKSAGERRHARGKEINISFLLWHEIILGFLGGFVLGLYLGFDFVESTFLAFLGSASGIYFHEMHHFVTARQLILEKEFHISFPYSVGFFHQELTKALKGEQSNSYIKVNIGKRGIGIIYPREILSPEENLKVDRSGYRANVRFLISFAILGIFFSSVFTVIAMPSFVQGGFSTFREGMKRK